MKSDYYYLITLQNLKDEIPLENYKKVLELIQYSFEVREAKSNNFRKSKSLVKKFADYVKEEVHRLG